jgi:hypothetical protein
MRSIDRLLFIGKTNFVQEIKDNVFYAAQKKTYILTTIYLTQKAAQV